MSAITGRYVQHATNCHLQQHVSAVLLFLDLDSCWLGDTPAPVYFSPCSPAAVPDRNSMW